MIGALARDTKFSIVTDEAPNQLTVSRRRDRIAEIRAILSLISGQREQAAPK